MTAPGTAIAVPMTKHATSDMPMWRRITPTAMPILIGTAARNPIAMARSPTFFHLLSKRAQSKGRLFALLVTLSEKLIYISVLGQKVKFSVKLHCVFCNFTCIKRRQIQLVILYEFVSFTFLTFSSALILQLAKQQHSQSLQVSIRRRFGA